MNIGGACGVSEKPNPRPCVGRGGGGVMSVYTLQVLRERAGADAAAAGDSAPICTGQCGKPDHDVRSCVRTAPQVCEMM